MAKEKSIYTCTECGGTSPRWQGKCPNCEAWNTLVESVAEGVTKNRFATVSRGLAPA
jgi:DNA repair protein RadA/Sms